MKNLIKKIRSEPTKLVDFSLFLLLSVPWACMFLSFNGNYSSLFFGLWLMLLLPVGVIVIITQIVINKRENHLDAAIFVLSIITALFGVFGWMMIYIVTG